MIDNDASQDTENIGATRPKMVDRVASTPATLSKVRGSRRQESESPLRVKDSAVRKVSGRVGSAHTTVSATAVTTARKVSGQ